MKQRNSNIIYMIDIKHEGTTKQNQINIICSAGHISVLSIFSPAVYHGAAFIEPAAFLIRLAFSMSR